MRRRWRGPYSLLTVVSLTFAVLASACQPGDDGRLTLTLHSRQGATARLSVEVAETPYQLEQGLAGRTGLPRDAGMLFVIDRRGAGFWMKDVAFPLSVAFISECGEIVAIADMEPYSLQLHDTELPYRFGLEVNRSWFSEHAIGVGDGAALPRRLRRPGCP